MSTPSKLTLRSTPATPVAHSWTLMAIWMASTSELSPPPWEARTGRFFAETYDHRYLVPMAIATAFAVLTGAYFLMQHVFYAQGVEVTREAVRGVDKLCVDWHGQGGVAVSYPRDTSNLCPIVLIVCG